MCRNACLSREKLNLILHSLHNCTCVVSCLREYLPTSTSAYCYLIANLSWTQHVKNLCTKARKILGLLYRRLILQLGEPLPNVHLPSPSQTGVWSPLKVGEVNSIEGVQKFALRMCAKNWDANYEELLQLASVPNMQQRRVYLVLCSMFRIIHGLFYFYFIVAMTFRVTRSSNPHSFICPFARTCYYYNICTS